MGNKASFMYASGCIEQAQQKPISVIILVGNKSDWNDQRQVTKNEGKAKAKEWNTLFIETSAKSGTTTRELFLQLIPKEIENAYRNERVKPLVFGYNAMINKSNILSRSIDQEITQLIVSYFPVLFNDLY